ncbi:MAG: zinc ribbon domain-containing protein [Butyrivibrio sp.]|uniref:zinc ribbon domain-containing protein n=1 Tax=Butyrivibrio sp. TaxID=28121 RepID=UPI0025D621D2|nr:zinc ribbon domain-containing protein [Butyrivibrio sp.]MCR5773029.1 zinc ribbon domain-containing protein [Butyrivibrio sp.]
MKCANCGADVKDGSLFCPKCGAKMEVVSNNSAKTKQSKNPVNKKVIIGVLALVVSLAIVVFAVVLYIQTRPVKIDLNQYVTVEYSGYDTVGNAVAEIDYKQLKKDYKEQLKFKGNDDISDSYKSPIHFLEDNIVGELDNDTNLTNGDTIVYNWNIDTEMVSEHVNVELVVDSSSYTVSGLEKVKTFDPFEGLTLNYEGTAPNGTVSIANGSVSNMYYTENDYSYSIDKKTGLNNGDVITVYITTENEDAYKKKFIENYGVMPESISKEYTVEGLESWVTSLDDIPEEEIAKMQKQALDAFTSQEANFVDEWSMRDPEYIGAYLLVSKDSDTWNNHNYLYLIYHVTADYDTGTNTGTFDYYYGFSFYDLKINSDGSFYVDLNGYRELYQYITQEMKNDDAWGGTSSYYFYGYKTLDELIMDNVNQKASSYTYETNIEESETTASEE